MALPSISAAAPVPIGKYTEAMRRAVIALSTGEATFVPQLNVWRVGTSGPVLKPETMNALAQRSIIDVCGRRRVGVVARRARLNAKGLATLDAIRASEAA